jgi:hypothetical protein
VTKLHIFFEMSAILAEKDRAATKITFKRPSQPSQREGEALHGISVVAVPCAGHHLSVSISLHNIMVFPITAITARRQYVDNQIDLMFNQPSTLPQYYRNITANITAGEL